LPALIFRKSVSKNVLLVGKLSSKNAKFAAENPRFAKVEDGEQSQNLSTCNLSCWKLQLSVEILSEICRFSRKLQHSAPRNFLTHPAAFALFQA